MEDREVDDPDDDWLLATFGALAWEALIAFAQDPSFFADMVEEANRVDGLICECGREFRRPSSLAGHQRGRSCPGRDAEKPIEFT